MSTYRVFLNGFLVACALAFSSSSYAAKQNQTITFPNPGAQSIYGTPSVLAATASSGLPVTYTSKTATICTVTTVGDLTFITTGNCQIQAAQAGDTNWNAAANVTVTFAIGTTTGFDPDLQPTGWVGEVTVSTFKFATGNATLYKPDYASPNWSGNLFAFPVSAAGVVDFTHERWNGGAAAKVNAQNKNTNGTWNSTGRVIVTHNGTVGVPFTWATTVSSTTMTAAQQASLGDNTTGPKVLNYVRGDFSNEAPNGADYRPRITTVLGDIMHSRPTYVPDTANPRIYVGANDGMLHAFNANTGAEVFAYIPSMVISKLKGLTDDADPFVHQYYVDASPNWAQISATQKVLVGGLGAGGRGLFALDISNPTTETEASAKARILWEITPSTANYGDLGQTYGRPVIGKISTGAYAVIVGNGYNGRAHSVLYVINPTTGAQIAKIQTSTGTGLSSPTAIDVDGDGVIDYVYAGDIDGNLWKFDLTSTTASSWTSTKLFTTTLKATTAQAQAITGAPSVRPHPTGAGYIVTFGSGRMLYPGDSNDSTSVAYVYGIWDNGTPVTNIANLVSQTLTEKTYSGGARVHTSSSISVDWTTKQGWTLALPTAARVVGDGGFISPSNGLYTFTVTNPIPTHADASGIPTPKGENWLMEVRYDTGGAPTKPIFDMNADGSLNDSDLVSNDGGSPPNLATGVPVSRLIAYGVLSQPLEAQTSTSTKTYFNANMDLAAPVLTPGVPGGHFDFDIYYGCDISKNKWGCDANDHKHEYDDTYHVSGVNMLNPSNSADNLSNAPDLTNSSKKLDINSTKPFKILLANQKFSPGVEFKVGSDSNDRYIRVTDYLTNASMSVGSLPTYSRAGTGSAPKLLDLVINMPLNTFTTRNWATDSSACTPPSPFVQSSTCRVGLVPGDTGCVRASGSGSGGPGTPQWMDGALTIQVIDTDTTDADIQLADASLGPTMGYRLINTSLSHMIAQYTIFWHSPNHKCMADVGYNWNPPIDTSSDTTGDPPTGSGDPVGGFNGGNNAGGTSSTGQYVQQYFVDGTQLIMTATRNSDNSISVSYTYSDSQGNSSPNAGGGGGGGQTTPDPTTRGSWKLVVK